MPFVSIGRMAPTRTICAVPAMKTFRHILVPLDHEPHSREALEYAVSLADRFGAEIAIVHGDAHSGGLEGETIVVLFTKAQVPALAHALQEHASAPIHALLAAVEDVGTPQAGIAVDPADPAAAVLHAAHGADLVVMGSHGRTGARRLLSGSVAETVARRAPCPVMIVHAPGERARADR